MSTYPPNSTLVVSTWINTIPTLRPACCASELPENNASWGSSGFAVLTIVGGAHGIHSGALRSPVVQLDCYAIKPNSEQPLWAAANRMMSLITAACDTKETVQRLLTLPNSHGTARVLAAYQLTEEKRVYRDNTSAAIMQADFHFMWRAM